MSGEQEPIARRRVGVVGGGQLARMMGDEAHDVQVTLVVLAEHDDDSAVETSDEVQLGSSRDLAALTRLAASVDVVTFDHELVDLEQLAHLEDRGVTFRPDAAALRYAVDKAFQRRAFADAGLPVPRFVVVREVADPALLPFLNLLGDPPVVKAARGGYDGRGVLFPATRDETLAAVREFADHGEVLVEERLSLRSEFAQQVACAVDGSLALYPVVTTVQREGMCVEVRYPSVLGGKVLRHAEAVSRTVAALVAAVGVLAIEYFDTDDGLVINEVALRPHNSAHWTIEGAATSQFAQHLLAVSGQPLGEVEPRAAAAVMVNVVGGERPGSIEAARATAGLAVHDYGKRWRPGRKLGHVTALDDDVEVARVRAWTGARAYGTATRED